MSTSNKIDAAAFMKSHFKVTPRDALAVYVKANSERRSAKPAFFMEQAKPMPKTLRAEPLPKAPQLFDYPDPPEHLAPQFKGFTSAQQALDCLFAFRAAIGKLENTRNRRAERYVEDRGLTPMAISTTGNPETGGYLVPTPIANAIIAKRSRVGVSRQISLVLPMSSIEETVPLETTGLTTLYAQETAALTASDFMFGQLGLNARKRYVFAKASNELADDAMIVWLDQFIARAAYALANTEDGELVLGNGTSTYDGEMGLLASLSAAGVSTAATGHDTWAELDVDDFTAVMAKLPSDYANGSEAWLCSPQFYAAGMLASVNGAFQGVDSDGRPTFLNKPVYLTPKMPTTSAASTVCCLYGAFPEGVVIGDRGISFASSDRAPGAFEADLTMFRAISRYDINVHAGGDASTAGAYVGLSTAASS